MFFAIIKESIIAWLQTFGEQAELLESESLRTEIKQVIKKVWEVSVMNYIQLTNEILSEKNLLY